jgi:pSer/pThr/pTyr-binding forkhead associated (FHA) protein
MAGALKGDVSCGRCGGRFRGTERFCHRCGIPRVAASSGTIVGNYVGLLGGVAPAASNRRLLANTIDAIPVLAVVVLLVVVLPDLRRVDRGAEGVVIAVLLLAGYWLIHATMMATAGRSLGRLALKLRTVDDISGEPVPTRRALPRALASRFSRYTITADLRKGRDPLTLTRPSLPTSSTAADQQITIDEGFDESIPVAVEPVHSESIGVVLDSGARLELTTTLLIGRAPANKEGEEHPLFAWPDLSRSVSKSHALIEWSGTVLWVTDLHSSNGTTLVSPDGERQLLVPGLRGAATAGWTIELGERTLEVRPSSLPVRA